MNQDLFARFVTAVKAGKVEGFRWCDDDPFFSDYLKTPSYEEVRATTEGHRDLNLLCADIRRWLTSEGVNWSITANGFFVDECNDGEEWRCLSDDINLVDATEMDRHLAAALWWLEEKETK